MHTKNIIKELKYEEFELDSFDWEYEPFYMSFNFSSEFLRRFKYKLNWIYISYFVSLTEDMIIEFKDFIDWPTISQNQVLTEKILIEYETYIYWPGFITNDKISSNIKSKYIKKYLEGLYLIKGASI